MPLSAVSETKTYSEEMAEVSPPTTTMITATTTTTTTTIPTTTTTTTITPTTTTKAQGKYPQAQLVWDSLRAEGLSPEVCAGIMGNIMAEVGGQTLDLSNWKHWSRGTHYGICQWGGGRKQELLNKFGSDLEAQVEFLIYELKSEIDTYGYKYKTGFTYDDFIEITNVEEAALAFAKSYERCSSKYYNIRKENAKKAYNYFM